MITSTISEKSGETMYYIKLDEHMVLASTQTEPLYRGENLARNICFLIPKELNGRDPAREYVYLCYIRPGEHADIVQLTSDEDYDGRYHAFYLPINCSLTSAVGRVLIWLQIYDSGENEPVIAKSNETCVTIYDVKNIGEWLTEDQVTAIYQMQAEVDDLARKVAEKADNLVYDREEQTLQLLSDGVPIGDKIHIGGGGAVVLNFQIIGKDLFVYFDDGRVENLGKVVGDDGKVYVPHIDEQKILTFTIEDMAGEIPEPTDLNPFDEWEPIEGDDKTDYIWEPM